MYRILLVDDEEFFRQGLKELVDWTACGFTVMDEADNGEDAFYFIREHRPDVVITDIRMPVLDGLELIRKVVQEELTGTKFIIVSGYDEFKYAQQAVKYGVCDFLLKPIDEEALQDALIQLKERLQREERLHMQSDRQKWSEMMTALIKGEYSEEQLAEWLGWMEISENGSIYYLFIELNDAHRMGNMEFSLQGELRKAMAEISPEAAHLYVHEHRERLGLAIAAEHLPHGCDMKRFAGELQAKLHENTGELIYIYASRACPAASGLREAYQSARETLQYKFAVPQQVLLYEDMRHITLNYILLDNSLYTRLTECMEENNELAILDAVNAIFDDFRSRHYVPEAVKASMHRCVSDILNTLRLMDISKEQLRCLEPIISWQDSNITLGGLKELFTDFVLECAGLLYRQRKDMLKGSIQKIKSYIDANYMANISLKSIAAQFYMNSIYVGQLFKKNYGIYFNDYVLQLRVNEAKRLIRQTDMRIYEIAERVGFNNVEYFVTQFEKSERMTPTEYRNMLK